MRAPWIALLLALTAPALAAAGTVEDRASELRRAETRAGDLTARMEALTQSLDQVAARIETLKARGRQLADRELDELLRRSQELADSLSSLARDREGADAERRTAARELAAACDAEIERLRAAIGRGDRGALERFSVLDGHRARARRHLGRPVPLQTGALAPSDDPDELREQADLLRDQRDRVRARLGELSDRIGELEERAALEREMGAFLREGSLFDEQQRVMRLTVPARGAPQQGSSDPESATAASDKAGRSAADPEMSLAPAGVAESFDGDTASTQPASGAGTTTPPTIPSDPVAPVPPSAPATTTRSLPRFGGDARSGAGIGAPLRGNESLSDLQAARAILEHEARELERRASELERRARSLDARD